MTQLFNQNYFPTLLTNSPGIRASLNMLSGQKCLWLAGVGLLLMKTTPTRLSHLRARKAEFDLDFCVKAVCAPFPRSIQKDSSFVMIKQKWLCYGVHGLKFTQWNNFKKFLARWVKLLTQCRKLKSNFHESRTFPKTQKVIWAGNVIALWGRWLHPS